MIRSRKGSLIDVYGMVVNFVGLGWSFGSGKCIGGKKEIINVYYS